MPKDRSITARGSRHGLALLGVALALPLATVASAQNEPGLVARLLNAEGKTQGHVYLLRSQAGVSGKVEVWGLTPGEHGMHIHTVGKCEGEGFSAAGGHFNPEGKAHGLDNPNGAHVGDLPAIKIGKNGRGTGYFNAPTSTGDLLDPDGSAFVVHAAPDDQKTDPTGNSGARVLCGVLEPGYF